MKKKTRRFNLKTSERFIERLQVISGFLEKPASEIVREAVNEKIDQLALSNPKVAEALKEIAA